MLFCKVRPAKTFKLGQAQALSKHDLSAASSVYVSIESKAPRFKQSKQLTEIVFPVEFGVLVRLGRGFLTSRVSNLPFSDRSLILIL